MYIFLDAVLHQSNKQIVCSDVVKTSESLPSLLEELSQNAAGVRT